MNKTTEALKLAEEALEGWKEYDTWTDQQMWNDDDEEALAAIREALAETVQEHESREDIAAKEMFEGFSKAWTAPVKQEPVAWRRFQKAMGNDAYAVEYASVGEIADAVVDLIVGTQPNMPLKKKESK